MRSAFERGFDYYDKYRDKGQMVVDVQAIEHGIIQGEVCVALGELMENYCANAYDGKGSAMYQRAIAGWLLKAGRDPHRISHRTGKIEPTGFPPANPKDP